jgi:hypothetical protein
MADLTLNCRLQTPVQIDMCAACQAFWFDTHESLKLSPASTLQLMKQIGEHTARGNAAIGDHLACPRCGNKLLPTQDLQRTTRFSYWRCNAKHGRFIRFFEFLKEKNFIRQLSREQIEELRRHVQTINCSNCGAPIDLVRTSACTHCGSPLSMLDMKHSQETIRQLEQASVPRQADASLPIELARAKREVETAFAGIGSDPLWWNTASSSGLVQAGLDAVVRWLAKSGV